MPTPITAKGMKGFLLWFQREQPAIYNKIAPTLPGRVPKAFSNYTQAQKKLRQVYKGNFAKRGNSMSGLADYSSYTLAPIYVTAPAISSDPITVNYSSQLAPAYYSDPATLTTPIDVGSTPTISPVAAAANTSSTSNAIASAIAQTVGAASSVYLTNQQAALQQSIVQSQLARAAAGLPPLNTSLNQLGVPTVSSTGTLSTGTMMLLGGAALLAIMLSGGSKKV
jgi:hypothetical protein